MPRFEDMVAMRWDDMGVARHLLAFVQQHGYLSLCFRRSRIGWTLEYPVREVRDNNYRCGSRELGRRRTFVGSIGFPSNRSRTFPCQRLRVRRATQTRYQTVPKSNPA